MHFFLKIQLVSLLFVATSSVTIHAQSFTEEPIPNIPPNLISAQLKIGFDNSLHILALAESSSTGLFYEQFQQKKLTVLKRDAGSFSPVNQVLDSTSAWSDGYEGNDEAYSVSWAIDSSDHPVVSWSKQLYWISDVLFPRKFGKPTLSYAFVDNGKLRTMFRFQPGVNPSLALGKDGVGYLTWECLVPFQPQLNYYQSSADTNYYFSKSEIYYAKMQSNSIIDSTRSIGRGFRPQIHIDKKGLLHLVWLLADSSNSSFYRLAYARGSDGGFSDPQIVCDSIPALGYYNPYYETPSFDSFVDDSGNVYVGMVEMSSFGNAKIVLVTVGSDNIVTIDSLGVQNYSSSPVTFFVERSGIKHVLWSTADINARWTLHYSRALSHQKLFDVIRDFRSPVGFSYNPHLFVDSRDTVSAVFTDDPTAIGFVRNLPNGSDSVIDVSPGSSVLDGTWDQWGNRHQSGSVVVDQTDQVWITANHNGPTLIKFDRSVTGICSNMESTPGSFSLSRNFPNPFNPSTTIRYQIPEEAKVTVRIYNLIGQQIATLVNEQKQAGSYSVEWNAENVPSGVYFYRTEAVSVGNRFVDVKKMILLK